ncbi:hypothetical protein G7067_13570 [Leucobacter insecticola]|uniref:Uncharacterized protein n=1 Tax=Leucobacter insecticola TaxID=2714934 RepID=A0A6G8FLI5_9MICO|nr:hypothetical protein [Leucobacter insecticola]QIM17208.1 hypothetical protein G7067_13570 [Leucobacter insecticola]
MIPLGRGCYISRRHWEGLYVEGRQIATALAHSDTAARQPVFSHYTAAALWGFPLFRFSDTRIHELTPSPDSVRSSPRVFRHRLQFAESELSQIAGVSLTSPLRTLLDIARSATGELALGCADAALRQEFFSSRLSNLAGQEAWREDTLVWAASLGRQRGANMARRVVGFADGRAESVLESVGRLRFARAGIRTEIQVRVPGPERKDYFLDYELLDHNAFAEADGAVKYFDEGMTKGRDPRQVILEEKEREDWIRGTQAKPIYRFGMKDLASQAAFEKRFASFHVFGRPNPRDIRDLLP